MKQWSSDSESTQIEINELQSYPEGRAGCRRHQRKFQ